MADGLLLLAHAGFTLIMTGIMWTVQLTVYPQFKAVPEVGFQHYIQNHSSRIVSVLMVFAPVEVVLALAVAVVRPGGLNGFFGLMAGAFLAAAWVATGLWYAPLHGRLQQEGRDQRLVDNLILSNWFRTVLWSARGVMALIMLWPVG